MTTITYDKNYSNREKNVDMTFKCLHFVFIPRFDPVSTRGVGCHHVIKIESYISSKRKSILKLMCCQHGSK